MTVCKMYYYYVTIISRHFFSTCDVYIFSSLLLVVDCLCSPFCFPWRWRRSSLGPGSSWNTETESHSAHQWSHWHTGRRRWQLFLWCLVRLGGLEVTGGWPVSEGVSECKCVLEVEGGRGEMIWHQVPLSGWHMLDFKYFLHRQERVRAEREPRSQALPLPFACVNIYYGWKFEEGEPGMAFSAVVGQEFNWERPQVGMVPYQALPLLQFFCA